MGDSAQPYENKCVDRICRHSMVVFACSVMVLSWKLENDSNFDHGAIFGFFFFCLCPSSFTCLLLLDRNTSLLSKEQWNTYSLFPNIKTSCVYATVSKEKSVHGRLQHLSVHCRGALFPFSILKRLSSCLQLASIPIGRDDDPEIYSAVLYCSTCCSQHEVMTQP